MTRDGDGDRAWCVAGARASDAHRVTYAAYEVSTSAIAVYVARRRAIGEF